jgi:hypothetical protein
VTTADYSLSLYNCNRDQTKSSLSLAIIQNARNILLVWLRVLSKARDSSIIGSWFRSVKIHKEQSRRVVIFRRGFLMKTSLFARMFSFETSPLIPRFRYSYFVELKDWKDAFAEMKEVFVESGGRIVKEESQSLTAEISAAKLMRSIMSLPDLLRIELHAVDASKVKVTVTSLGERKLYLSFFAISIVISILGILKKGELFALIFPLGTYGIVLQHSVYPQHPAHKKLKDLLREMNEEPSRD